jgi:uncharacterized membrane protein YhaH (DUF805 family)
MNFVVVSLGSIVMALVLAMAVVLISRRSLHALLVELCGTAARADYWSRFAGLFLVLCTLYGVLISLPLADGRAASEFAEARLALASFRASVLGMLLALAGIAFVLLISIRRHEERAARKISSLANLPPMVQRDPPRGSQA